MRLMKGLFFTVALLLVLAVSLPAGFAQETTEIGNPPNAQNALEIVGQIDQNEFELTIYGYVTHLNGLDAALLFADGTEPLLRGEDAARFTFKGSASIYSRSTRQPIFATDALATIDFYYNETPLGSNFDNPDSFVGGTPIFSLTGRLHNILNVQQPDTAVVMSSVETVQQSTAPFTLGGQNYIVGHDGLTGRFTIFGEGFRRSLTPLTVQLIFGGNMVTTGD